MMAVGSYIGAVGKPKPISPPDFDEELHEGHGLCPRCPPTRNSSQQLDKAEASQRDRLRTP